MAVKFKDYYQVLGVERSATADEIQRAYRKLARKFHPDINKEPDAEDKFKEINEAYEVLKDPENRKKYDTLGANWKSGQEFTPPPEWEGGQFHTNVNFGDGADFSDFFRTIFGGGFEAMGGGFGAMGGGRASTAQWSRPGEHHEAHLDITLEDAFHGAKKKVQLESHVRRPDGAIGREVKSFDVTIPKGVTDGSKIRLAGQGGPGIGGGPAGDLHIKLRLAPHPRFKVHGHDVKGTIAVSPWEATLGAEVPFETLEGSIKLKIPAGSQSGQTLRLRGKGLPKRKGEAGDMLIAIQIKVPKELTDRERELFEALAKESHFRPRD